MIDTHAHLNVNKYKNNVDEIIQNALDKGVSKIIVIGMDYESSKIAIDLANKYDNLFATVGIHPGYVDESNHLQLDYLYNKEKVIAVGEIGLDYYWRQDNKELQEKIFRAQLEKAISLNLPVVIHTRNSFNEAYNIVKEYEGKLTGVFHCFSGTLLDAIKTIELGFYIGIDGPITFNNNEILKNIVKEVPLDKILIETDSPYLTPVPFRGKTNEPANVYYVAKEISKIKNLSFEEVVRQTTTNANKLFKLEAIK